MNENKKLSLPAVGASSLLVRFAVLCLTVFALLSISTVRADGRLGDQVQTAVEGYYHADCQAEEILARLRCGELPAGVTVEDGIYTYACPISDTQVLAVQVTLQDDSYQILRWQALSTVRWEADDRIPVWNGAEE